MPAELNRESPAAQCVPTFSHEYYIYLRKIIDYALIPRPPLEESQAL